MADKFINNLWEQVKNGAFADREALPVVIHVGIKMHLEALDRLNSNIESLRDEIVKIEQKLGTEDLNQENKEINTL